MTAAKTATKPRRLARIHAGEVTPLPLDLSEKDFERTVIETAILFRCRVNHARPALNRAGKWMTAIQGHPGLPDWTIARDGWVLLVELKKERGRVRPDQRLWLAALGTYGRLWRPSMWIDEIYPTLRDGPAL